ncbi:extensin-like domain-containing protein [Chelatococcus reniformis]|uniref:extensin-like domain-containing protein n=1 Tax=Chelatococcus reniformis TaxID=1494448 RepID=UPI00166DA78C|nr:extensin family protein [Chelatococcus reniformis]
MAQARPVKPAPAPATAPLPPPRPPELAPRPRPPDGPGAAAPAVDPAAFAACLKDFADRGGEAAAPKPTDKPTDKPADMAGACAIPAPVTFARLRLFDGSVVTLDSAVTVRCSLAVELVTWIRDDLTAIARRHGAALAQLTGVGGHACRPRNGQAGAPISEHASGNAFDMRALKLADRRVIELTDPDAATKSLRDEVKTSACARFTTVLGPGADSAHASHLHVDLRERRGGFRMCQWNVD